MFSVQLCEFVIVDSDKDQPDPVCLFYQVELPSAPSPGLCLVWSSVGSELGGDFVVERITWDVGLRAFSCENVVQVPSGEEADHIAYRLDHGWSRDPDSVSVRDCLEEAVSRAVIHAGAHLVEFRVLSEGALADLAKCASRLVTRV